MSARTRPRRIDGPDLLRGTALAVLGVVPLRGHTLTYLAGGPVIAALTGTLVLAWRTWEDVAGPLRALVLEPATS